LGPGQWKQKHKLLNPHISHSAQDADRAPREGTRPTSQNRCSCRPGALTRRSGREIFGWNSFCSFRISVHLAQARC